MYFFLFLFVMHDNILQEGKWYCSTSRILPYSSFGNRSKVNFKQNVSYTSVLLRILTLAYSRFICNQAYPSLLLAKNVSLFFTREMGLRGFSQWTCNNPQTSTTYLLITAKDNAS